MSWIGERAEEEEAGGGQGVPERGGDDVADVSESASAEAPQAASRPVPKFMTLLPVTARLTEEEVEWLESAERHIMRSRDRKHERITKNTLLRAAVELLMALRWEQADIADEEELVARLKAAAGAR